MLINTPFFGSSLASKFSNDTSSNSTTPSNTVVLMRRHGFTTWGPDIKTAVYRAVYTRENAAVQANAMALDTAFEQSGLTMEANFEFGPLTEQEAKDCKIMNEGTQDRPWAMWVKEVERNPLYDNTG
jgi:ribulose-5-phosphate 4-epimerase/fuculose-1-phosphate aldolase